MMHLLGQQQAGELMTELGPQFAAGGGRGRGGGIYGEMVPRGKMMAGGGGGGGCSVRGGMGKLGLIWLFCVRKALFRVHAASLCYENATESKQKIFLN